MLNLKQNDKSISLQELSAEQASQVSGGNSYPAVIFPIQTPIPAPVILPHKPAHK